MEGSMEWEGRRGKGSKDGIVEGVGGSKNRRGGGSGGSKGRRSERSKHVRAQGLEESKHGRVKKGGRVQGRRWDGSKGGRVVGWKVEIRRVEDWNGQGMGGPKGGRV